MSWTDERIALLKRLWKDGKSAAEIAKTLSKGVTRNAVIGKAHRMGLSGRPSPIKKPASVSEKKSAKAPEKEIREIRKPVATPAPSVASGKGRHAPPTREEAKPEKLEKGDLPPGGGVALIDLTERMCKWPIGDPREDDFTFCGHGISGGTPYCQRHAAMAYQSSGRSRAPAAEEKVVEENADDDEVVT
ncbi:MAG: GcrA family cell cycle regulator [Pseudomonadota bacterium]